MQPETSYSAIVGRILARKREELGWDQARMAEEVGVNRSSWSRIENGDVDFKLELLSKIAGAMGRAGADDLDSPVKILSAADKAREHMKSIGFLVHDEKHTKLQDSKKGKVGLVVAGAAIAGLVAAALLNKDSSDQEK